MLPTTWKSKGSYFDFQEHQVFFRTEGKGPALLLLHGFPTASWDWHKVWTPLTNRYRVIALDFLGFGFSDKPKGIDYTIFLQADIVEYLLFKLDIQEFHLLAHDYGNTVAQELLARSKDPSRVSICSICFLNGGLFPETHRPLVVQRLLMSPIGRFIGRMMTPKKLQQNFNRIFGSHSQPTPEELKAYWELIQYNDGLGVAHLLIRYMRERRKNRSRWVGGLEQTSIPLRLIDGLQDPISGVSLVERYRKLIPEPDVVELPLIGHYPQMERPNGVLSHYFEFRTAIDNHKKTARRRFIFE